jgi:hypothetical protein
MNPSDRRDSYRLDLEPGRAIITVGDRAVVDVRDLSASGGSLILRGGGVSDSDVLPAVIELEGGEAFETDLEVVRMRPQASGDVELGARFGALKEEALHKLSRFITREFHKKTTDPARLLGGSASLKITSTAFISSLFRGARPARERTMFVVDGNVRLPPVLRIEGLVFEDGRRLIRARCAGDPPRLLGGRPYTFVLAGAGAVVVFDSHCVRQKGLDVFLALPPEVRQTGFRDSPRVPVERSRRAEITFSHPRLSGDAISVPLFDIAGRGISFPIDPMQHALFPGDRLAGLRMTVPDGTIEANGIIRSIASKAGDDRLSCGVELLEFGGKQDADRWRHFVFSNSHPRLVEGTGRADEAWRLLESSRYVELWTSARERRHVRKRFLRSWDVARPAVGHSLLLGNDRESVGLSAGSLVYPNTWMLHHLGVDAREQTQDALSPLEHSSELISGLVFRLRDFTDLQYFVIYVERGKRWNDRLYRDFAARYFDEEKLLYSPFSVYRRATGAPIPPAVHGSDGVRIVRGDRPLMDTLAAHLEKTLPAIECKALALDEERIDLKAFTKECAARDYVRRRDTYFAIAGGKPVAALLAESGDQGVNIFGLLNACRVFALEPEGLSLAVRETLLRMAVGHYRRAGAKSFLFFDDEPTASEIPQGVGYQLVSPGMRWIAHRDVIPAWAAYLKDLLNSQGARDSGAEQQIARAASG